MRQGRCSHLRLRGGAYRRSHLFPARRPAAVLWHLLPRAWHPRKHDDSGVRCEPEHRLASAPRRPSLAVGFLGCAGPQRMLHCHVSRLQPPAQVRTVEREHVVRHAANQPPKADVSGLRRTEEVPVPRRARMHYRVHPPRPPCRGGSRRQRWLPASARRHPQVPEHQVPPCAPVTSKEVARGSSAARMRHTNSKWATSVH